MKAWILALGALSLAACASSGPREREHQTVRALLSADAMMYASFDSDNDLRVTNAEIEAGITREFARADTSHDGSLQALEFAAWSNAALGGNLTAPYRFDFDRNVDNIITAEEFRTEILARAHDYDANNDGVLTRDEFIRQLNQTRPPDMQRRIQGGIPGRR